MKWYICKSLVSVADFQYKVLKTTFSFMGFVDVKINLVE